MLNIKQKHFVLRSKFLVGSRSIQHRCSMLARVAIVVAPLRHFDVWVWILRYHALLTRTRPLVHELITLNASSYCY